jgi:hypothetical protein
MISNEQAEAIIANCDGLLELEAAFVARDWMTPGRRLGLDESQYDAGKRGWVCERWLASTTPASNRIPVEGEGLSFVRTASGPVQLDELVKAVPSSIMGEEYAATHSGLGRLAKIFDYGERVPFHIHPPTEQAEALGLNSKDEAYYFLPSSDLGLHPESFFGVHPSLREEEAADRLVGHLKKWDGDRVLEMSRAYHLYSEGGYFVPSGVLHAPGTALTLELQEDSDAMAFLQASCGEVLLDKELLLGAFDTHTQEQIGERAILDWVDWELNRLADFHSVFHIDPAVISDAEGVEIAWLFWGGEKFSSKRVRLTPGSSVTLAENGVYSLLVWTGDVSIGGRRMSGGTPGKDELLVTARRAVEGIEYVNTSDVMAEVILFFGPDINPESPIIDVPICSNS